MGTPDILDFEQLLNPISAEQPCGEDLREDKSVTSLYHGNDAIKQKLQEAREIERKHPDTNEDQDENFFFRQSYDEWRSVDEQARVILASSSKDLEITAWLIEALVRTHGFAGLRDGFRLANELIVSFWDDLHPPWDEDDDIPKAWPLIGLNGTGQDSDSSLVRAIWRVSLVALPTEQFDSQSTYTFLNYKDQSGNINDSAAMETLPDIFNTLREDITQCQEQFEKLCHILDEKFGSDKVMSSHITKALSDCRDAVRDLSNEGALVEDAEESIVSASSNSSDIRQTKNISSRENALQSLLQVANYFEQTEPHSPIPSLLRQAVRWARMSYAELLSEMITDESALKKVFVLTGINSETK